MPTPCRIEQNPLRGPRLAAAVVVILILAAVGRSVGRGADDQADRAARDRKAKVALALAGAAKKSAAATPVAVAPAPRPVPKDYATGYKDAVQDARPLVVFVSTAQNWPVEGAECSRAESFPGVKGPAVVVAYPQGSGLMMDATLPGEPDRAKVDAAVKAARRKIDRAPGEAAPAAPAPLNWQIYSQPAQPFAYRPFGAAGRPNARNCAGPT